MGGLFSVGLPLGSSVNGQVYLTDPSALNSKRSKQETIRISKVQGMYDSEMLSGDPKFVK